MPDYVIHDNGKIIAVKISADPSLVEGLNAIQVSREVAESITKYYLVDNGQVREMTQAEKDILLAEEAQAQRNNLLSQIDKYEVSNLDLLTALVKRINVRIPANPITKQELVQQLKSDLGL